MTVTGGFRVLLPEITYAGHQYDDVLGLYYAKARMYDADHRRFPAMDPVKGLVVEPMTLVQYLYVLDNPVTLIDPNGKFVAIALIAGITVEQVLSAILAAGVSAALGLSVKAFLDTALTYSVSGTSRQINIYSSSSNSIAIIIDYGYRQVLQQVIDLTVFPDYPHYDDPIGFDINPNNFMTVTVDSVPIVNTTKGEEIAKHYNNVLLCEGDTEEDTEGDSDSKKNKIPDNDSTTGHIFRDAEGHIPDTPENRALLEDAANDSANFRGTDKYGNEWYTKTQSDGSQVWVESRNGNIFEGGVNDRPKPWNPETGLKKP